jgi:hypothetical protein
MSILPIAFFVAVLSYLLRDELRRVFTTKNVLTSPITAENTIEFIMIALIFVVAVYFSPAL